MKKKWTTYDEVFWETCPGEIIDMNSRATETKKRPMQAEALMQAKTSFQKKRKAFLFWRTQPSNS